MMQIIETKGTLYEILTNQGKLQTEYMTKRSSSPILGKINRPLKTYIKCVDEYL